MGCGQSTIRKQLEAELKQQGGSQKVNPKSTPQRMACTNSPGEIFTIGIGGFGVNAVDSFFEEIAKEHGLNGEQAHPQTCPRTFDLPSVFFSEFSKSNF